MKKRIVTPVIGLFLGLLATSVASGKTVALWPVEYDVAKNAWNPFGQVNAVDGSYPLHLHAINLDLSTDDLQIGWELPPNPDPSVPLERARNRRAVVGLCRVGAGRGGRAVPRALRDDVPFVHGAGLGEKSIGTALQHLG